MSLLFTFSCEDNIVVDEETSMKLWLDGVEVDVEANYEKITTYGEEVEYIADDELVEITPKSIRLRKRYLDANDRKKMEKKAKG